MNGSILPLQQPGPWALLSSGGRGFGVYWLYIPFYKQTPLEIFQMLLGDTQRVKLFICSKLFICVFEILNPGGPLISMIIIFFFRLLYQRHKRVSADS